MCNWVKVLRKKIQKSHYCNSQPQQLHNTITITYPIVVLYFKSFFFLSVIFFLPLPSKHRRCTYSHVDLEIILSLPFPPYCSAFVSLCEFPFFSTKQMVKKLSAGLHILSIVGQILWL